MNTVPGITGRRLLLQGIVVALFCASLWFFLDARMEQKALNSAIDSLRQEKIHYDLARKELIRYLEMRTQALSCLEYSTPLVWEQVQIQLGETGFPELYSLLRLLDQNVQAQYGTNSIFIMENMEMKSADPILSPETTNGFSIRGYVLSICKGDG
ncbi:hypothetical protein [Desulfolithobacter sp.]